MSAQVLERLFASLHQLEQAIAATKISISKFKTPNPEVVSRLECYEQVLQKQKVLAEGLAKSVGQGDWAQVGRFVDLIRGSSVLIQLDSQSIISELQANSDKPLNLKYCA